MHTDTNTKHERKYTVHCPSVATAITATSTMEAVAAAALMLRYKILEYGLPPRVLIFTHSFKN